MKFCITTDQHYGARSDSQVFYEYQKKSNEFMFDYLRKNNIKRIFALGDLYDRKKYVNYITASRSRSDFLDIIENEFEMDIIIGNHDTYHKNTNTINSLTELLRGYNNIHVHHKPTTVDVDGVPIFLLPWICPDNYEESMAAIKETPAQICFGHLELSGFETNKGVVHHGGMEASIFQKFQIVCSGHFHHKSTIGNIHYVGAAYEFTWADWNDPRGFSIFDTDTRSYQFIRNPYSMFHMFVYDDVNKLDEIEDWNFDMKDAYVKIVAVNKTNPNLFDAFMDKIYKAGAIDITVVEDTNLFSENEEAEELLNQGENTITLFNKYIDGLSLDVNPIILKDKIKNIYLEAVAMEETHDK